MIKKAPGEPNGAVIWRKGLIERSSPNHKKDWLSGVENIYSRTTYANSDIARVAIRLGYEHGEVVNYNVVIKPGMLFFIQPTRKIIQTERRDFKTGSAVIQRRGLLEAPGPDYEKDWLSDMRIKGSHTGDPHENRDLACVALKLGYEYEDIFKYRIIIEPKR